MRIAVVLDAVHPYSTGGRETLYRHVIAEMHKEGHEVTVYTMKWWDGPKRTTSEGVTYQAIMGYVPLYTGTRRSISHALRFAAASFRMVTYEFDVIDADHMPYLQLFPLRLVAWLRRVPLVATWHELWGPTYWREYLGPLGGIAAAFERLATMLPRRIIANSPETQKRLIDIGVPADRVVTLAPGVEIDKVRRAEKHEGYDLLYAGRLLSHKGVELALESIHLLHERGISVTFGVVGIGPQSEELKRRTAELGLTEHVAFLGNLQEQSTLFSLMKGSRLFVLPSVREGFGLVVLEAAAAGLPTITINHPDNYSKELVIEGVTGWVCEPTAAALADAIANGLRTPLDVATGAVALLQEYRWEAAGAKRVQVYRNAKSHRSIGSR